MEMTNAHTPRPEGQEFPSVTFTDEQVIVDMLRTTTLDTLEKIKAHRRRVIAFYSEHYGMRFREDVHDITASILQLLEPIVVLDRDGNTTD
jgi:hypothetical protein